MTIVAGCARDWPAGARELSQARPQAGLPEGKERLTFEREDRWEAPGRQGGNVMYKRIVLAVDLGEPNPSPKGLAQAMELATASGGELRLVNVQPVMPATFMEYVPVDFDVEQAKRAKDALDAILASINLPAERKSAATRAGGIYHELLQEASEWDADLIVVGSHRPVMSDYLLGSNAKTIVRHAQCSVLVVRE